MMIARHGHRSSRLQGAPTPPDDFAVANRQLRSRLQGAPTPPGDFAVANRQSRSRLQGAPTPPDDFAVANRQSRSRLGGAPAPSGDFAVANRQSRSRLEGDPTPPDDFAVANRQSRSRLGGAPAYIFTCVASIGVGAHRMRDHTRLGVDPKIPGDTDTTKGHNHDSVFATRETPGGVGAPCRREPATAQ